MVLLLTLCSGFKILDTRITPGSQTRGDMCQCLVEVGNSPLEDESDKEACLKALAEAPDEFLNAVLTSVRESSPMPEAPESAQVKTRFWFKMQQQRRPPQQGVWLLEEMMPVKKTLFQQLNEGGEEFEGDDSG